MGMFDWVYVTKDEIIEDPEDGYESTGHQSKDGPCLLECLHRDAVDENGAWVINYYYGDTGDWRRGPGGWVKVDVS